MSWLDYEGGGIFISENTWFLDFRPRLRLVDLDYALDPGTLNGYIILRAGNSSIKQLNVIHKLFLQRRIGLNLKYSGTDPELLLGRGANF